MDKELKKNIDFVLKSPDEKFRYGMLSRLKHDCNYYLGFGHRDPRYLWADNEKDHIAFMRALYDTFSDKDKPEWLTKSDIDAYEKKMVGTAKKSHTTTKTKLPSNKMLNQRAFK